MLLYGGCGSQIMNRTQVGTYEQHRTAGLCAACVHATIITSSRGSTFFLCQLSQADARFPRYPRLPVVRCEGYVAMEERRDTEAGET
jgi:hypothetical protein